MRQLLLATIPFKASGKILPSPRDALPQASTTLNRMSEYILPLLMVNTGLAWGAVIIEGVDGVLPIISYINGPIPRK